MEKYTRGVSAVETILTLDRQVFEQSDEGILKILVKITCRTINLLKGILILQVTAECGGKGAIEQQKQEVSKRQQRPTTSTTWQPAHEEDRQCSHQYVKRKLIHFFLIFDNAKL